MNHIYNFLWKRFLFIYNVSHFDSKCCESHLPLFLNRLVQTHPLTTVINNQMNSVLFYQRSVNGIYTSFHNSAHSTVCCHLFNLKLKPSTFQPTHFWEVFRKPSHHVSTKKGNVVKQSGNDVEGCRSQKVLFQPNMRVFLQYSVKTRSSVERHWASEH